MKTLRWMRASTACRTHGLTVLRVLTWCLPLLGLTSLCSLLRRLSPVLAMEWCSSWGTKAWDTTETAAVQ
eukprot:5938752-Karenia_brevis.AAC.1